MAAVSAWAGGLAGGLADGLAVLKADAVAAGNAVACGDDSCDDNIPRTYHS